MKAHRQLRVSVNHIRAYTLRFSHHLYEAKPFHNLLPRDFKLQFSDAITHTMVRAKTKRRMLACFLAIDDERFRIAEAFFVAIS